MENSMIIIDYRDRRPIYEQVVDKLKDLMMRGVLPENGQLPSVRNMATDLSINPNTIQRAYAQLEREGFLYSVKGKGSFVSGNAKMREWKKREICETIISLVNDAKCIGMPMLEFQECVIQAYGRDNVRRDEV